MMRKKNKKKHHDQGSIYMCWSNVDVIFYYFPLKRFIIKIKPNDSQKVCLLTSV